MSFYQQLLYGIFFLWTVPVTIMLSVVICYLEKTKQIDLSGCKFLGGNK